MPEHHNVHESAKQDFRGQSIVNEATPGISYYTPLQRPPAGTATLPPPEGSPNPIPKLFVPLRIRGLELQNRLAVSPMCQYSAQDGHHTDWHFAHLGGIVSRGPGLTMVEATSITAGEHFVLFLLIVPLEATSITAGELCVFCSVSCSLCRSSGQSACDRGKVLMIEGRITPEDSGLWKDSQIAPLQRTVEFAHSQGQKIGIQLGHAGRKASTVAPWLSSAAVAGEDVNGWPDRVVAPSAVAYSDQMAQPKALTLEDIDALKHAWTASVKRALTAGFDLIEIHSAHGYLFHSFLSPASNKREDQYGGSFENRTRLVREIILLTRDIIPKDMPLFLRVSATDWLEEQSDMDSWKLADTIRFAEMIAELGVDLLDVSTGGLHPLQKVKSGPAYQAPFATAIKAKLGDWIAVSSVGSIKNGSQANQLLDEGLDLIFCGRMFQKDPALVWTFAEQLGVQINIANQIRWGFGGRPGNRK